MSIAINNIAWSERTATHPQSRARRPRPRPRRHARLYCACARRRSRIRRWIKHTLEVRARAKRSRTPPPPHRSRARGAKRDGVARRHTGAHTLAARKSSRARARTTPCFCTPRGCCARSKTNSKITAAALRGHQARAVARTVLAAVAREPRIGTPSSSLSPARSAPPDTPWARADAEHAFNMTPPPPRPHARAARWRRARARRRTPPRAAEDTARQGGARAARFACARAREQRVVCVRV